MRAFFCKMWCIDKYGLIVVNFIFTLLGLTLLGVSVACALQLTVILDVMPKAMSAVPRIGITLGLLIFFIAFFGCWIRENKYYLIMYGVSMIILASSKIYLAVVLFQNLQIIEKLVAAWVRAAFNDPGLVDQFHEIESTFQCCGTTGPDSYTHLAVLPSSCCPQPDPSLGPNQICNTTNSFTGCNKVLTAFSATYGLAIGIVVVLIIVVELTAMFLSFYLCNNIDKKEQNVSRSI